MKILIWTGIALAFVCQWSMSPADACSMPTGWRPISLERRLYDADLVVYARAVGIRYSPYKYLLLYIQVQVSPHQCSTPVIIGSGEQVFVLNVSGYPIQRRHMSVMASQITGTSIVCSTAGSDLITRNTLNLH